MRLKQIAITRYIAIILLAIFGSTPVFAAETADQILDRTAKQISTAPSISELLACHHRRGQSKRHDDLVWRQIHNDIRRHVRMVRRQDPMDPYPGK